MKRGRSKGKQKVNIVLALLLVVCMLISGTASMLPKSYAAAAVGVYQVGENVTATLYSNGCLSLSGSGDTYDYNPGVTAAPFYGSRLSITSVEIGGQITAIGDYLFYNCGNLTGSLTIPASVVRIGTRAFSGDSPVNAPSLKYIYNKFIEGDIVVEPETDGTSPDSAASAGIDGTSPDSTAFTEIDPAAPFSTLAQMQPNSRILVADGEPDGASPDPVTEAPAADTPAAATSAAATPAATEAPVPAAQVPMTAAPASAAADAAPPVTEAPATEAPATEAPATEAPAADTKAPMTEAPVPDTKAPVKETTPTDTKAPATEAPPTDTKAPATEAPSTDSKAPATEAPQNGTKQTEVPQSDTKQSETPQESHSGAAQTSADETDTNQSGAESETTESGSETLESESDTAESETEESESAPESEIRHITQQEIGGEIFYPGQTGVYHADGMQNTSFINAAAAAGYRWIDGWTQLTFDNGAGESRQISVPVASGSVFLPDDLAVGLPVPEDAYSTYEFLGWADGAGLEPVPEKGYTAPWNFTSSSVTVVTAVWQKNLRNMEEETISANVTAPDGSQTLGVSITGKLPANAGVLAEMLPIPDAQAIVDSQLGDGNGSTVLYALDISIIVDGEKYQPSDYGESVQVSISDISVTDSQPLHVWHVAEDENGNASGLEDVAVESVETDALAFSADSFSTYIVAVKNATDSYRVNIAASDRYKLYSDAACTQILESEITVEADGILDFWLQAETYGETPEQYYEITAYMAGTDSQSGQAVTLEPVTDEPVADAPAPDEPAANESAQGTENVDIGGRYHYRLTVTSNTSIWFTSAEAGGQGSTAPRAELDLQDGSVTIEASGSEFLVTYGNQSWTWSGNTFYITSAGAQTGNTFTLKSGIVNVYMDSLNITSSGSAVNVLGGTLNLYVANGMTAIDSAGGAGTGDAGTDGQNANSGSTGSGAAAASILTSSSAPAIGVSTGASLFLTAESGQTLSLSSGASPAIGGTGGDGGTSSGAGNVQITNNSANLTLNTGNGAAAQIVAKQYTYITNSNTGALPFTAALSDSKLVGYFTNGRLYSADAEQTVTAPTSFQSCGVSYDMGQLTVSESVTADGGLEILAAVNENDKNMPMKVSVTRDGALAEGTDYTWKPAEGRLTVIPQSSYGNLYIAKDGDACYLRGITAAQVLAGSGRVLNLLSSSAGGGGTAANAGTAANGAATLLYDMQYVPDIDHPLRLDFSQPLPAGTELTFIDFTSGGAPAYYYYHATGAAQSIPLTAFCKMGTALAFSEPVAVQEGTTVSVKYQICVDFPEGSSDTSALSITLSQGEDAANSSGTYGASGNALGSGTSADGSTGSAGVGTVANTAGSGTPGVTGGDAGSSGGTDAGSSGTSTAADTAIELTAVISRSGAVGSSGDVVIGQVTADGSTMNVPVTVNASGQGNAVLILRLFDAEDQPAVFPEKTSCPSATSKTVRGNCAIFDLGAAQMNNAGYTVVLPDLSAGSYKVQAEICVVPSEEYASPMHGLVGSSAASEAVAISGPAIYGITAELAGSGDERIVSNDTGNQLTFNVTYTVPENAQANVDISIESKATDGFYGLEKPNWTISGPVSSGTSGDSSTAQYTVSIPAGTTKGTYRINFTLNYTDSSGKSASVTHPYNIIVQ